MPSADAVPGRARPRGNGRPLERDDGDAVAQRAPQVPAQVLPDVPYEADRIRARPAGEAVAQGVEGTGRVPVSWRCSGDEAAEAEGRAVAAGLEPGDPAAAGDEGGGGCSRST
ncbi:hypothetical protein ACFZAU_40015 [Streptomyces sp. NPDC008238]